MGAERKVKSRMLDRGRERETGLEPATSSLGSWHSTTELLPHIVTLCNLTGYPILSFYVHHICTIARCGVTMQYIQFADIFKHEHVFFLFAVYPQSLTHAPEAPSIDIAWQLFWALLPVVLRPERSKPLQGQVSIVLRDGFTTSKHSFENMLDTCVNYSYITV